MWPLLELRGRFVVDPLLLTGPLLLNFPLLLKFGQPLHLVLLIWVIVLLVLVGDGLTLFLLPSQLFIGLSLAKRFAMMRLRVELLCRRNA